MLRRHGSSLGKQPLAEARETLPGEGWRAAKLLIGTDGKGL